MNYLIKTIIDMKLKEYQEQSKRTCPDLGSEESNLCHMVLGIHSEWVEYWKSLSLNDQVNSAEELTDIIWYISNYCNFRGYDIEELFNEPTENDLDFTLLTSLLQDLVKKKLAYKKEIDKLLEKKLLIDILDWVRTEFDKIKSNLENSLQNNIDKLKVRYPEKFSEDKAINRNLELERKELEK